MRRDLYADVSARIVAELEHGAAPWVKPWSVTPGQNVPQNAVTNRPYSGCNVILLWLARNRGWATPRFLTFKQALEAGGHVRKGEHGTKVYFVKQLQVKDGGDGDADIRLVPMLREYTVFNVDQCDGLPDSIRSGKPMRVRNPDTRDLLADEFCDRREPIFVKAMAKPIICQAKIASRCHRSKRSKARITSITSSSMSSRIGLATSHGSIAICGTGSAHGTTQPKNWSPNLGRHSCPRNSGLTVTFGTRVTSRPGSIS